MADIFDGSYGFPGEQNTPEQLEKAKRNVMHRQTEFIAYHWHKVEPDNGVEVDNEAINILLLLVSSAIRLSLPLLPEIRVYMADALLDISCGMEPKEALGYKFNPGESNRTVANAYNSLLGKTVEQKLEKNKGMSVKKAREEVAKEFNVGERTIERHHLAYKNSKT